MSKGKYYIEGQVPVPHNPKYSANESKCKGDDLPCIICGKPVKQPKEKALWVRLGPAGKSHVIPREIPDQGGAEMGCWPIGPDCARKYPKIKALSFHMREEKKTAIKGYTVNGVQFTQGEYERIMAALRLRSEACDENGERQKAAHWRKISRKIIMAFVPFQE